MIILQNTFEILLFPNIFWAFCLNGLTMYVTGHVHSPSLLELIVVVE